MDSNFENSYQIAPKLPYIDINIRILDDYGLWQSALYILQCKLDVKFF